MATANWTKIGDTYYYKGHGVAKDNVGVYIEYDTSRTTATTTYIRFNNTRPVNTTTYKDGFYILYNANKDPDSIGRVLIKLHAANGKWPDASSEIKITKAYTADTFTIQDFWICNSGQGEVTESTQKIKYDSGTDTFYNFFKSGGSRELWVSRYNSQKLTGIKATAVGAGSVSITDNFNNSYTVKGTGGSAGTNNDVTSATLTYPNASGTNVTADCKGKTTTKTVAFTPSGADDTKTIKASVQTVGTYNTPGAVSASLKVKQYEGPSPATSLRIGYNKSRFTLKEPWVLSWQEPATNYSCPIRGYRIHLYRKRGNILTIATAPWVNLPIYDQNGRYISTKVVSSGDVYCELDYSEYGENLPTSLTIYPEYYNLEKHSNEPDIKPGDYISFSVSAYTKYGENYDGTATDADGQKLCFKSGANESYFINNSSVGKWDSNPEVRGHLKVQNAGVVRVKTASGWKEGQVYVRVNGKWVEAETVNVKSGSSWKESE